jgi:hypothetical protein
MPITRVIVYIYTIISFKFNRIKKKCHFIRYFIFRLILARLLFGETSSGFPYKYFGNNIYINWQLLAYRATVILPKRQDRATPTIVYSRGERHRHRHTHTLEFYDILIKTHSVLWLPKN